MRVVSGKGGMQAGSASSRASSLASYALGLACGTSSSFRLGLPEFQLMRGHIVGPAVRCLHECWAQPAGLLRHAGGSVTGAWVQILRVELNYREILGSWFCRWPELIPA